VFANSSFVDIFVNDSRFSDKKGQTTCLPFSQFSYEHIATLRSAMVDSSVVAVFLIN
jgi:hypothetical protein